MKKTISQACQAIAADNHWDESLITMVQREDGSGLTFNYTHIAGTTYFIRFSPQTGNVVFNSFRDKTGRDTDKQAAAIAAKW